MYIPSSSTLTISCYYILLILFLKSSCAYVVDSNDLTDSLIDQQLGLNWPSSYDRYIRSTKFPRIGRSSLDSEESSSIYDVNTSTSSEENSDEDNDNELQSIDQRSVLFSRIGKRAFHNLLWASSLANPHRVIDAQGRFHLNGYDSHIHQTRPQSGARYRGKRSVSM